MKSSILAVVVRKEFQQFFRNPFLPRLCLMFPIVIMLIMPLVTNMEVKHVGVVVVDNDRQEFSRQLANSLRASDYLSLYEVTPSYATAIHAIEQGDADVIVDIPDGFYKSLFTAEPKRLKLSGNAVNATKGTFGLQYVQAVVGRILAEEMPASRASMLASAMTVSTLHLFNPTLDYRYYMIPALMIMLIVMLCGFLPALNIVSEKEVGTIEQINVSPISHLTFTLGKVLPYWIIGLVVLTVAMTIAWAVYGLAPRSSIGIIYGASALFFVIMSCFGITIANGSQTMQQSMFVMFFFVMIFILMSGLMTPIQSMPSWAQTITYAIPPRYYIDIMRAGYLRGSSFAELLPQFGMLAAFAVVFALMAVFSYRKQS